MPGPRFREGYFEIPSTVKSVNAVHDAAAGIAVWTPGTGKKIRVLWYDLQVFVSVTLQNAAVGDHVVLYDSVTTAPIALLGVCVVPTPLAGSVLSSGAQQTATPGAFAPAVATGAQSSNLFHSSARRIPGGYLTSAADNVLKVALVVAATQAVVDVGTGELNIIGTIGGHEE